MSNDDRPVFDLHQAFINKQAALRASFLAIRSVTSHPTTKGDQLEADWVGLLRDFLPARYTVGPIFAVDHRGAMSEQIDVAVYDKQFSPQWFGGANGVRFVPVESVYAAFEVKPQWDSDNMAAAMKKAASVRILDRTSDSITHAGGHYSQPDRAAKPILAGILSTQCEWADHEAGLDRHLVTDHSDPRFLNIGIALERACFDYTPDIAEDGDTVKIERTLSPPGQQLIHFVIRLFRQLQTIGTVPAVDMEQYEAAIRERGATSPSPE